MKFAFDRRASTSDRCPAHAHPRATTRRSTGRIARHAGHIVSADASAATTEDSP